MTNKMVAEKKEIKYIAHFKHWAPTNNLMEDIL